MGGISDFAAVAAPAIGAYLGGPAGAAAGSAISGYLGTQSTNEANAERADQANAWSAAQYASRYQTMTKDLQAAGLNPMLAYSQGAGAAPTAQQVTFQNPVASATQAYQAVRGTEASASQSYASAAQAEAQVKQIDATVDKIKEETKNIPVEGDRLRYTIQYLAEQAAKAAQEGETQVSIRRQIAATVDKIHAERKLLGFDIAAIEKMDNFSREYRQYAPIIDLIKSIFLPRSAGITINK